MIRIPGKIPITIRPLFWLVALLIGWMWTFNFVSALLAVGVIVISVLFHELGHALTAIAFGQETRIELAAFGGFTYRQGRKLKLWEEFLVVFNGPLAGILLFAASWFIFKNVDIDYKPFTFMLQFSIVANLFWTIINLLPILPLDGGHLLSIILEAIFGFKGVKMAIVIGLIIGVGLSLFFFIIGQFLLGALFLILTFESFRSLRYYKIFSEKDRDTNLQELLREGEKEMDEGHIDAAEKKLEELRGKAKEGILFTVATQELAELYKKEGKYKEAYELLKPVRKTLTGESLSLLHFLAYKNRDYQTVAQIANEAFQTNPNQETALINALAYAALGKVEPAIGWLECAIREGLSEVKEALKKEELDPIRKDPRFKEFAKPYEI